MASHMASLPKLSIAAKLYIIFALVAAGTAVLATSAVVNSQRHAALAAKAGAAFRGALNVERVDGLIYAVVMESRGVYMTPASDMPLARKYAEGLLVFNARIGEVVDDWRRTLAPEDAPQFEAFAGRIRQFQDFRRELARRGVEIGPEAGREWGDNDANRSVLKALSKDIEVLARMYDDRSKQIYAELEREIQTTAWILSALAVAAIALAALGAVIIWRGIARPLAAITRIMEAVARGTGGVAVPFRRRRDEIGALARSIGVFQDAMLRNEELNRKVIVDAEARARRQDEIASQTGRFAAEIEATVAQLGRIADEMVDASARFAGVADQTSARTEGAAAAAGEASRNVHDIAAAAEELSVSVMEINRQVAQSNAIAERAVAEAERTNAEIKALDDAARRIGDVVRLITDIAGQTNLLALNATIEAARAGESGRGFAVVANEVKALAGETAKATEEISGQIAAMQAATARSVDAIASIQRTIREAGAVTTTIAASVSQQGMATVEIARSAEVASKSATESANGVGALQSATTQTRGHAVRVKTVADNLGDAAARIRGQVGDFVGKLRSA